MVPWQSHWVQEIQARDVVWAGSVFGVEGDGLHDAVVSVHGHDIDLVSVCVDCVRHVKYYHFIIGAPGFGVGVNPDS